MNIATKKGEPLDRTQAWLAAWIAVATSSSCVSVQVATNWADNCLRDFDERFPTAKQPDTKGSGQ